MMHKKAISTSTVALIATGLIIVACSDKAEDSDDGGNGGSSGTATGGTATGGTSGTGTGGTATGGTATGGTATGGTATGGTATGGSAGSGTTGGSGGSGGTGTGPFACDMPKAATCGQINDFGTAAPAWGMGEFNGGVSVFGAGITRDMSNLGVIHITGMVTGYGHGFNLWFSYCSSLATYTGVTFTANGTTTAMAMPNTIDFQIQTNTDYPWQPRPQDMKGGCTAPDPTMAFSVCIAPSLNVPLGAAPQTVTWMQMMGGMPTAWSPTMSPSEVIGLQWQFPWSGTAMPYTVDITLDNVQFTGGTGPTAACPMFMAGGGGMGGAGGAGGGAGGAGGAGGGAGGMAAGAGGAGAGMSGAGGAGGRGGMAGAGGT